MAEGDGGLHMGSRCTWLALGRPVRFFLAVSLGSVPSECAGLGRVSFSLNVCSFVRQWEILENVSESCQTV